MLKIKIINRATSKIEEEQVYGQKTLTFLYSKNILSWVFLEVFSKLLFFSRLYGALQSTKLSRKKIVPFIEKYKVNKEEFKKEVKKFTSFNDFFIRELKKEARPIVQDKKKLILPSDARYLVFPKIKMLDDFYVKDQKFNLSTFLQDEELAKKYHDCSMVIARLCPSDYHRFHFPCDCTASEAKKINGYLYSVNPISISKNIAVFSENKRMVTLLKTKDFGEIVFVEIGATNVGTINQTYDLTKPQKKGEEKGYFSFGGSSVVMLFEPGKIIFDEDLIENSKNKIETKAFFGQSLGRTI